LEIILIEALTVGMIYLFRDFPIIASNNIHLTLVVLVMNFTRLQQMRARMMVAVLLISAII
jgi:hypothetical protein